MEAIAPLLILGLFGTGLVIERLRPARRLPKIRGWMLRCVASFVIGGAIAGGLPALAAVLIGSHTLLDLGGLGAVVGGVIGFILADLAGYAAHRFVHNVPVIWRWTHQLHHSAERLDVAGGVYFHPFDHVALGLPTLVVIALLGLSPDAAALAGLLGFAAAVFQHMNIRTPQWLGYIVQRPESHAVHHARGVHAYNYANFPLWDIVFGTFRNPADFAPTQGFWDGASARIGAMLLGRDVAARTGSTPTFTRVSQGR